MESKLRQLASSRERFKHDRCSRRINSIQFLDEYKKQLTKNNKVFFVDTNIDFRSDEGKLPNIEIPNLENIEFVDCNLNYMDLGVELDFNGLRKEKNERKGVTVKNVLFKNCRIFDAVIGGSVLNNVMFENCDIGNNSRIGECEINNLGINNVFYELARATGLFTKCKFSNCDFLKDISALVAVGGYSGNIYNDCSFNNVKFSYENYIDIIKNYHSMTYVNKFSKTEEKMDAYLGFNGKIARVDKYNIPPFLLNLTHNFMYDKDSSTIITERKPSNHTASIIDKQERTYETPIDSLKYSTIENDGLFGKRLTAIENNKKTQISILPILCNKFRHITSADKTGSKSV